MSDAIDDITLRMFSNKKLYSKYLETADPENAKQREEYRDNVIKYRARIRDIFYEYLDNPDKDFDSNYNGEMTLALENLTKTAIRYLEMRDLDEDDDEEDRYSDEDMMFGKIEDTCGKIEENEDEEKEDDDDLNNTKKTTSVWGKKIARRGYHSGTIDSFFNK